MAPVVEIDLVSINRKMRSSSDFGMTGAGVPNFPYAANSALAQNATAGASGGVAVVDSGIADHPDFGTGSAARVIVRRSFVPGESASGDGYGHGPHVAGIIAGSGARSAAEPGAFNRLHGVAPSVRLLSLKVLDRNGEGRE
ncbi:MAG: S8 family serine peptidase, partial [Acidobacteriota bacterium]